MRSIASSPYCWQFWMALFIANNLPYNDYDWDTKKSGKLFDPLKPFNDSQYNTGAKILPPAQPAFFWYSYDNSAEFPLFGNGGRTAMAGPTYYQDDYPKTESKFPKYYDGKLFIYEWMRGWMMSVTLDEEGIMSEWNVFFQKRSLVIPLIWFLVQRGFICMNMDLLGMSKILMQGYCIYLIIGPIENP